MRILVVDKRIDHLRAAWTGFPNHCVYATDDCQKAINVMRKYQFDVVLAASSYPGSALIERTAIDRSVPYIGTFEHPAAALSTLIDQMAAANSRSESSSFRHFDDPETDLGLG